MTIAQQLGITEFPFEIKNSNGNTIYRETSTGFWAKREFDARGNEISYRNSIGYWAECEYDANGNQISFRDSDGFWSKREYDANGSMVYRENNEGIKLDKRPETVELTLDEIAKKLGIDVNLLKIKK
jgi:YD repeat-containing protein